jgi:hypothetical protein
MKTPFYFYVELPEPGISMTWIGGALIPSEKRGRVWLTTPAGEPVLEVEAEYVHASSMQETAARIIADRAAAKIGLN